MVNVADNKKGSIMKVICLGNVSTGKTSIIKRYVTNEFSTQYRTTIGVDFMLKHVKVEGVDVKVQFWDLAGQERFAGLSRAYYRHAGGAVVVFDLTARDTFDAVINWKKDIDQKIELPNGQKLPVILLGNKCDLLTGESPVNACVTEDEINAIVQDHGFFRYYPCSALDGTGIAAPIEELVQEITRRMALDADGTGSSADYYHQQHTTAPAVDISKTKSQSEGGCC